MVGVAPLVAVGGLGNALDIIDDTRSPEEAGNLVVVVDCARQRIEIGPTLDDGHAAPRAPQHQREQLGRGAIADDRHIHELVCLHVFPDQVRS